MCLCLYPLSTTGCPVSALTGILPAVVSSHVLSILGQGVEEYAGGLVKTFPDVPCVSQILGGRLVAELSNPP